MDAITSHLQIGLGDILDSTQAGIFVLGRNRQFLVFNRGCERLTGYSRQDVIGHQCACHQVTDCRDEHGRSLTGRLCPGLQLFQETVPSARQRMRIRRRDGGHTWVETTYTPLQDDAGNVACVLGVMHDVSEAKATEDHLREMTEDLRGQVEKLRGEIRQQYGFSTIVSRSPKMQSIFERIRAAGNNSAHVLISGEPGTGKEMIARTIHYTGLEKDGPFVPLNCSALPADLCERELFGHAKGAFSGAQIDYEGLLRAADGGTLFLDEITGITLDAQARLLRALEERRIRPVGSVRDVAINVRVIASITTDPARAVAEGTLRKDLFLRLGVIGISVPPLRERKEDIPCLVEYFISQFARTSLRRIETVSQDAWRTLLRYDWPGNVGELQNAIESACAVGTGPELAVADLPELVRGEGVELCVEGGDEDLPLDEVLATVERQAILAALRRAGGQRSQAARAIGISRSRLYRRMEALGIRPREDL